MSVLQSHGDVFKGRHLLTVLSGLEFSELPQYGGIIVSPEGKTTGVCPQKVKIKLLT